LKIPAFAPEAQGEGSQTLQVWLSSDDRSRGLTEFQNSFSEIMIDIHLDAPLLCLRLFINSSLSRQSH
jgi:hypothetical protein